MKKIIVASIVGAMMGFVGCDKLPTPEKIEAVSTVIGRTAGYVCELSKTKTEVKDAILKVMDVVATVVPTNGETFVEAWTPIANAEIQKLVDSKKLDEASAALVKNAVAIACEGIDYVFIKYPKAKDVKELVSAATMGFIGGFKSVVSMNFAADAKFEIDEEAYKYLKEKMPAK